MRVKEAAKHCPKCVLISTEKHFCNAENCPMMDEKTKLARFCDSAHMTPRQSLKLVPDLIEAIDNKSL